MTTLTQTTSTSRGEGVKRIGLTSLEDTISQVNNATNVGTPGTTSGLACSIRRLGRLFWLDFTFTAMSITVTDAGASGASGSVKIFDFVEGVVVPLGCRLDFTAFAEGSALTTAAGDAAFVMALGSVAANAGDGVLTSTEIDISGVNTGTITLSGGTAAATKSCGPVTTVVIDGSTTAVDCYLNWCGTAATIDATSTISVTGTATVFGSFLGDD